MATWGQASLTAQNPQPSADSNFDPGTTSSFSLGPSGSHSFFLCDLEVGRCFSLSSASLRARLSVPQARQPCLSLLSRRGRIVAHYITRRDHLPECRAYRCEIPLLSLSSSISFHVSISSSMALSLLSFLSMNNKIFYSIRFYSISPPPSCKCRDSNISSFFRNGASQLP